jgi:hypothetical protein
MRRFLGGVLRSNSDDKMQKPCASEQDRPKQDCAETIGRPDTTRQLRQTPNKIQKPIDELPSATNQSQYPWEERGPDRF